MCLSSAVFVITKMAEQTFTIEKNVLSTMVSYLILLQFIRMYLVISFYNFEFIDSAVWNRKSVR